MKRVDMERRQGLSENKEEWKELYYKRKTAATDTRQKLMGELRMGKYLLQKKSMDTDIRETLTEGYIKIKYFL